MKKIININLSGRVIPIEDSAYEKLQGYIESLRRHFANEEGKDEIINDIESRLAELMHEKVRKGAECITDADIDEIAASMGRPEDFEKEETTTTSSGTQSQQKEQTTNTGYSGSTRHRRLYRDTNDKFLGGVCSGIANYLNLDPTIVRILFAIITFGGFGFGILLYIILWIVLPPRYIEGFSEKRLYRNPDDRVIGGVAGGLAAYFNKRSSTIRLIFAAPILLNILFGILHRGFFMFHTGYIFPDIIFGSFAGTFIFIYVVLWIVLPEARSQYEKMEMRGEKVDVNTIRQNVQEGMQQTKDKMKNWSDEVKESAQNLGKKATEFANTKGKTFVKEASEAAHRTGSGLAHAFGVLFKVFFLFIAGSIAFGLFIALIALIFGGVAWWPINNFLWTSSWQQAYAWGTVIFFIGVPLIALFTWVIRRIIRVRSHSSYLGWMFGGLWVIGWIAVIMLAASITNDFREYEHSDTTINISQPPKGKMIVTVSEPELEYTGNFGWMNNDWRGWYISDDTIKLSAVNFVYDKSDDSLYHVVVKKYSAGKNSRDAAERAEQIQYAVSYKDSVLDLGNGFAIGKESKYRGQNVEVEIKIPVGKKIRFDESVETKLKPFNIHIYHYRGWRRRGVNIEFNDREYFPWEPDIDYIMTSDGKLKSPDGGSVGNDYKYHGTNNVDSIEKSIKQKEKEIKDLEDQKRKQEERSKQKSTGYLNNNINDNKEDFVAVTNSPVFSLVNVFE